jgi:phospholipid/cholesterol/gamma-HCH transport system substrate-binding protein
VRRLAREHFTDFVAIVVVFALAMATLLYILAQQKAALPSWIPGLGQEFYELEGEFTTAQAVTPGQGQAVTIAGIQVGKVGAVELRDGRAVVRLDIEPEYTELIHEDATLLTRPKTGLADMVIEVEPGTRGDTPAEGSLIPSSQTAPNVNPDEILATLDADTRDYLALLLDAGGKGLGGRGTQFSAALRRFEPTARDLARLGVQLAKRRGSLRRVIRNFRLVAEELGENDTELAAFVDSSNAAIRAFADQEAAIRGALQELPPTLRSTQDGLARADRLAVELRPTLLRLIPQAQALKPALEGTQRLFRETRIPIRDQIRPFTRQVQPVFRHLDQTSQPLSRTVRGLRGAFDDLNVLLNLLAYNPDGSGSEGYLFWLAWLNHNFNSIFLTQDAEGPLRRGLNIISCNTAKQAAFAAPADPLLRTEFEATGLPDQGEICENPVEIPGGP